MAATAAGGVFNAFSFAAAGYLFKLIDSNGYQKEMKRHDRAMEQLSKDKEKWNEQRLSEIDRINQLHYAKSEGLKDINATNKDFETVETKFKKIEPKLESYYRPSHQMATYTSLVKILALVPPLYAASLWI